jgi:hypothetical protein
MVLSAGCILELKVKHFEGVLATAELLQQTIRERRNLQTHKKRKKHVSPYNILTDYLEIVNSFDMIVSAKDEWRARQIISETLVPSKKIMDHCWWTISARLTELKSNEKRMPKLHYSDEFGMRGFMKNDFDFRKSQAF